MSSKLVYWDSCVWIKLMSKEKGWKELSAMYEQAKAGEISLLLSTMVIAEVCKTKDCKRFLDRSCTKITSVGIPLAYFSHTIQKYSKHAVKPPDAIHIATAALNNSIEMHTFDKELLGWSEKFDKENGHKLLICKPCEGEAAKIC